MAVWNVTNIILSAPELRGVIEGQDLPEPKRTSVADLLRVGYSLRVVGESWTPQEVVLFYDACSLYRRVGMSILGTYATVYDWISYEQMHGSKKPGDIKKFAQRNFNSKRRQRTGEDEDEQCSEEDDTVFLE